MNKKLLALVGMAIISFSCVWAMKKPANLVNEDFSLAIHCDDASERSFPINFPEDVDNNVFARDVKEEPIKGNIKLNRGNIRYEWYRDPKKNDALSKKRLVVFALGLGDSLYDQRRHKAYARVYLDQGYDVMLFDCAWRGRSFGEKYTSLVWSPIETCFKNAYKDVQDVIRMCRTEVIYDEVIGHAECQSCVPFMQAQAAKNEDEKMFDKLVLDSPITSFIESLRAIFSNTALWVNACSGKIDSRLGRAVVAWTSYKCFGTAMAAILRKVSNEYSILPSCKKVTIPVLFVRGKHDPMVSLQEFDAIVSAARELNHQVAVYNTPFHSSTSFAYKFGGRGRYCFVEKAFIEQSFDEFLSTVAVKQA